jgi:hypothetical protein
MHLSIASPRPPVGRQLVKCKLIWSEVMQDDVAVVVDLKRKPFLKLCVPCRRKKDLLLQRT